MAPKSNSQQLISGFVTGVADAPAAGAPAHAPMSAAVDPAIELYFHLEVVEEIPDDPFEDPEQIEILPGQQIHLRLTTSNNGNLDQRLFPIRGNLRLCLRHKGLPADAVRITDPQLQASRKDLDSLSHDFEITISNQCPRGEVTFELFFIEDNKAPRVLAAKITRIVAGNENPIDLPLLQTVSVTLNAVPPEQVAILHIEASSAGKYRLKGWNRRVDNLDTEWAGPSENIGLADFVEGKVSPTDVRGIVKSFSRGASQQLLNWFQQLYDKFGEQLCLIIADHSNAEIPWEMIEFSSGNHLGAMCIVARWIPVQNFTAWNELAVGAQQYCGGVIAHLDYHELQHTELERQALTHLKADFRDSAERLRQRLAQSLQDVGLVYLACHGIFTYNEKHKAAVGSLKNPAGRLSAVQLEDLQQHADPRPLFFVNACHSARVMRHDNRFYGLPEVTLALLAGGYIGTLGPVGEEYAPTIGQLILEKARCSPEGINPAEELRGIRAEAVQRLSRDQSPESKRDFIFTFMYVYYGNPLACLRLTDAGASDKRANE